MTGSELAEATANSINIIMDTGVTQEFVETMAGEHRTLQQGFTRLVIAWLKHLASLEENHFDLRNAASVKFAKTALGACQNYEDHLPLI